MTSTEIGGGEGEIIVYLSFSDVIPIMAVKNFKKNIREKKKTWKWFPMPHKQRQKTGREIKGGGSRKGVFIIVRTKVDDILNSDCHYTSYILFQGKMRIPSNTRY